MKFKRIIISASIVVALIAIVALRLISNEQSFDKELKMVSESNTTIPVLTDTVKYQQTAQEFSVTGTFSPSQEIAVTAETQGRIISINAEPGISVKKSQVLASLENEVFAAQLELAKFNLEKAEKNADRYKKLSQGDAATMQQYESAKQDFEIAQSTYTSAKVDYENTFIKAPFDGIITKRYIDKGAYVSSGSPVFDLIKINQLKFIAKLTASEADQVKKGQLVRLSVDAYPGINYNGRISAVIVKADLSKRYDVEIEVDNQAGKLIKPGMFGTVALGRHAGEKALVISRKAIAGSIKNSEVFLVKGDSVNLQKIRITPLNDKQVIVTEGLNVGDVVVTSGQISLVNGSKIKINN